MDDHQNFNSPALNLQLGELKRTYPNMTFEEAITSGGDERIELKENGLNKYLVNPLESEGVFNRGSCTCSTLSPDVRPRVQELFDRLNNGASFDAVREHQRKRMRSPFVENGGKKFDIFFAPSGSDLCFYPLLFTSLLHPSRPLMNLVTCPEELGTGSILANRGMFFSEKTQLKPVTKGAKINDSLVLDYRSFPSRTRDGKIIDHKRELYTAIDEYRNSHHVLVNLVIGSKSGIENNLSIIEDGPRDVTWVVDLCQMRAVPKLLLRLIELNCLVLITGSKFYQSPPFCGALIVPEPFGMPLRSIKPSAEALKGFVDIYTRYDIPPSFKTLRNEFSDYENTGLTLRWEAAICESETLSHYSEREITYAISSWNKHVVDYLRSKPMFELMRDQEKTNRSIISVRVRGKDGYFSPQKLKLLYERLLLEGHKHYPKYKKLTIGQPVEYEAHTFVRLALGSTNVRKLIDSNIDLTDDFKLIDILEQIALSLEHENT